MPAERRSLRPLDDAHLFIRDVHPIAVWLHSRLYEFPIQLTSREILSAWGRILTGHVPLHSIEITRECPLSCPWGYAYGESHLGGKVTLHPLSDLRGDALVECAGRFLRLWLRAR